MKSDYMMRMAHNVRINTKNKYDIIDFLTMDPLRRRALVASLTLEAEEIQEIQKNNGAKR